MSEKILTLESVDDKIFDSLRQELSIYVTKNWDNNNFKWNLFINNTRI